MTLADSNPMPPPKMQAIMASARAQTAGDNRHALRQAQLAGWYIRDGKWDQLAPNIQKKVQVRKAEKQPDGKFAIYNVPVFYPNAVKPKRGEDGRVIGAEPFSAELIGAVCENTNASIHSGAQAPPLTAGHTTKEQTDRGIQLPSNGRSVNFRQWKNGMMFCDLLDVEPQFAKDWMAGRMNGLSAAFVADAAGLNPRVGHVARLGGQIQALAYLPSTEIYGTGDQFAFSADPATFAASNPRNPSSSKGHPMKMTKAQCYAQMSAAEASKDAKEDGWESKMKEAETNFAATMMAEDSVDPTAAPGDVTDMPASVSPSTVSGFSAEAFAADPFGAIAAVLVPLNTKVLAQDATIKALTRDNAQLKSKDRKASFAAEVTSLSKLHEFAAEDFIGQFDAMSGNEGAITATISALKKFPPRQRSLADIGAVFDRTNAATPFEAPTAPGLALSYAADIQGDGSVAMPDPKDRKNLHSFINNLPN